MDGELPQHGVQIPARQEPGHLWISAPASASTKKRPPSGQGIGRPDRLWSTGRVILIG